MLNGLTFNGKHSSDFGLIMKSYRNIKPSMRKREIEIPGKDGGYTFPSSTYNKRIISCKFSLLGCTTLQELRLKAREISDWLSAENANLEFDDEVGKIYIATVFNSIDAEEIATTQEFTVDFECQPFAIGEIETHGKYIYSYEEYTVNNPGTKEIGLGSQQGAFFIIKITGTFDDISISMNGKTISYNTAITDSEIIIDNCNATIKENNVNVIHNAEGDLGDFLTLNTGDNLVIVDGTNLDVEITFEFKPLWK